jgi:hypothetical protein
MSSTLQDPQVFLQSFQAAGGWFDPEYFSLAQFNGMGWGGQAVKDIPVSIRVYLDNHADWAWSATAIESRVSEVATG